MDPERILVSVPNWVGDVVMATPALRALRQRYPAARIVHLMRPYVRDVLAGTDFCDEQVFWPQGGAGHLRLVRALRAERFDMAVLLSNSFRSAAVAWLGGTATLIGYARDGRSWMLSRGLQPLRSNGTYIPVPALDYYNELAVAAGCAPPGDRLELGVLPADDAAIDARFPDLNERRPLIVLNPGANYGSAKCWPAENYAELARLLAERYDARIIASLGPKERYIADRLTAARARLEICIDPPLGLGPLKALVRRADLLITNDTGPRHFAAALDTPVVTIFGSSDPAWTDTRYTRERIAMLDLDCQPCMERVCPLKHHNCMQQLEPALVLNRVAELLPATHQAAGTGGRES